jgi:hypothetical protein
MPAITPEADLRPRNLRSGNNFGDRNRRVGRAVEYRTSLQSPSPQSGNFLSTGQRLSAMVSTVGSIPGASETRRHAKRRVPAGFFAASSTQ